MYPTFPISLHHSVLISEPPRSSVVFNKWAHSNTPHFLQTQTLKQGCGAHKEKSFSDWKKHIPFRWENPKTASTEPIPIHVTVYQGFSILALFHCGPTGLCRGDCPVHIRMFISIFGFYPQEASSNLAPTMSPAENAKLVT